MNKIRRWFNKPKREVENQLIQDLPPEKKPQACHDGTVVMEMLSSTPQRQATLLLDLRIRDGGVIRQTKADGSDPDLILNTRLSMLRELLQGHISQNHDVADVQPQYDCPAPQTSAAPVRTSLLRLGEATGNGTQVELTDTGSSLSSVGGGASDTSHGLCLLKTRDGCSLPSSPRLGGRRRRLPCSLPCSPLLAGRRWRSPSSSPCPPSGLSRLWVEEALQRSKKLHLPSSCPPQVRQEGEEDRRGETEEEGDEDKEVKISGIRLSDAGIVRLLSSPRPCGNEEEEDDEDELCVDSDMWTSCQLMPCVCLRCPSAPPYEADVLSPPYEADVLSPPYEADVFSPPYEADVFSPPYEADVFSPPYEADVFSPPYEADVFSPPYEADVFSPPYEADVLSPPYEADVLSPPYEADVLSPPFEADVFSPGHVLSVFEHQQQSQKHISHRTDVQRTEGDSEQSLPRDRAPQLGDSSRLYPSLSLWMTTADTQIELNRKQEEEVNTIHSCFHGNNSDDHLQQLCDVTSGVPGEQQILCSADLSSILKKVFDVTTCSKRTALPVESCSFCSHKLTVQPVKHLCTSCEQVFCGRCSCHFLSLHQIHQLSQTAAGHLSESHRC